MNNHNAWSWRGLFTAAVVQWGLGFGLPVLAAVARDRIGGAPPRRTIRPWMIVAAAVVAFVAAGWWFRRRRQGPAVDIGPDGRNPVREHTDRAASAVGS